MNDPGPRLLFWILIVVQGAAAQLIIWEGVPIYRRLLTPSTEGARSIDLGVAAGAVVVMQVGYWFSQRPMRRITFRRRVLFGHLLMFVDEISLFFVSALAVVIVFDRFGELRATPGKISLLLAMVYAVCCYKRQLMKMGDAMIDG